MTTPCARLRLPLPHSRWSLPIAPARDGVQVIFRDDKGERVRVFDFDNPENNEFLCNGLCLNPSFARIGDGWRQASTFGRVFCTESCVLEASKLSSSDGLFRAFGNRSPSYANHIEYRRPVAG